MAATSGLKTAIDRVSRMKDQPFKDKPVALRSAAAGILGGSRAQYHLRQCLTSIDAILLGRPEARSAAAHAERGRGRRVRRPYEGSFFAIVTLRSEKIR
jgi:NAD(P)H-dependent FMN reductase